MRLLLEPIPKLAMDANELTPDNDSVDKLKQSHVVGSFLFITDQEFVESIKKRVRNLNDPAMRARKSGLHSNSFFSRIFITLVVLLQILLFWDRL